MLSASSPDSAAAIELFSTSPALFVENQGQWADESVRFLHQGDGVNVAMTDRGPVLQLSRVRESEEATGDPSNASLAESYDAYGLPFEQEDLLSENIATDITNVSIHFDGANMVEPVGLDQAATVHNYYIGEEANWRSDVPTFETVAYPELYDGIDLFTWGRRDGLKYEFHVAPGSDYQQIQVSYDGIDSLWIDDSGAMHVETTLGELIDDAPYIYQQIGGEQIEVAGKFELIDADSYTFVVTGAFDPDVELVVDPNLVWSTYLGGGDNDAGYDIAIDAAGNVLVTGYTDSAGWVSGGFDASHNGSHDAFVAKLSPSGDHIWSTYLGGNSSDYGRGIAVDTAGNVLVMGRTESAGWASGGFDTNYDGGNNDVFVAKLSPSGDHIWSTYLGGSGTDWGYGIAVDTAGNALVTGHTSSVGWVSGGLNTSYNGGRYDAFVVKLSPSGDHIWSTYLGGSGTDYGYGITVETTGNVLVTGRTDSVGWVSGGLDTSHNGGRYDAFVAKLSPSGDHIWSTYLGGNAGDWSYGIAVETTGNVLVTGYTDSVGWVSGGLDTSHNGLGDIFVVKLSSSGDHIWSTYLGGSDYDSGRDIAVETTGNVLVTGRTDSAGWVSEGFGTSINGGGDVFVAKLSPSGDHIWSTYLGGSGNDWGYGIAVETTGNVLVSGGTESVGWISGGLDINLNGGWGVFVAKITDEQTVGDLNRDGLVSLIDLALLQSEISAGNASRADVVSLLGNYGHGPLDPQTSPQAAPSSVVAIVEEAERTSVRDSLHARRRVMPTRTNTRLAASAVDNVLEDNVLEELVLEELVLEEFQSGHKRRNAESSLFRTHRSRRPTTAVLDE